MNQPTFLFTWSCWLMTPSLIFEPLSQEAGTVVLASGTLAPTSSFKTELGSDFAARIGTSGIMEGMHVIDVKRQLFAAVLERGPSGETIDGSYKARQSLKERAKDARQSRPQFNNGQHHSSSVSSSQGGNRNGSSSAPPSYAMEIGHVIYYTLESIPKEGGVLVFVPSYSMLAEMETEWEEHGLLRGLRMRRGAVVFEPRGGGQQAFDDAKNEFTDAVDGGGGSLMIAVFRGKMSEGISFNDNYCRAVFCVGIPFPSTQDLQIKLKMRYNDARSRIDSEYLSGSYWYSLQAFRAVNQALGRCIRHLKDYGALFLVDARYTERIPNLARWLSKSFKVYDSFRYMNLSLKEFYAQVPDDLVRAGAWGGAAGGSSGAEANGVVGFVHVHVSPESKSEQANESQGWESPQVDM